MPAVDADYCPTCGTAAESVVVEGRDRNYCPDCDEVLWRNPVPTAGVVVRDGDRALVVERAPPRDGEWTVPGGFLEHDEAAPEGAARELHEETGLRVDPEALTLLATHHHHWRDGIHTLLIRYVVDRAATGGEPVAGSDAARARFVTLPELDDMGTVRPANRRFVRLALERDGASR